MFSDAKQNVKTRRAVSWSSANKNTCLLRSHSKIEKSCPTGVEGVYPPLQAGKRLVELFLFPISLLTLSAEATDGKEELKVVIVSQP